MALKLVEDDLDGIVFKLGEDSMAALEYIAEKHSPTYQCLDPVSHGGENIRFGSPKNLPKWGSFDNHPKMKAFSEEMKKDMAVFWNNKNLVFEYKPSFIFSELTADRDNIPQKAHCDFNPDVIQWELDNYQIASCFGVTPIHPDGCMILVWTEGKAKKFRTAEEKKQDAKRKRQKLDEKPGQYYLYIPKGIMVVLPGNTIHAGGFCFGQKIDFPSAHPNKVTFQNHRLHFFCATKEAKIDANGGKNTIIADNKPICYDDFKPDEKIMNILFENLLDHHPNFVSAPKNRNENDDDEDMDKKPPAKKV